MPLKTAFPWEEVSDPGSYEASEISVVGYHWLYNHTITLHKIVHASDHYHRAYTPIIANPYVNEKRTTINDGDTVWRISDY